MKSRIIITRLICLTVMSCSSPQSDGEMAAEAFNESEETYQKNLEKKIGEFIDKFDSYGFITRIEARKISDIVSDVRKEYDDNLMDAERLYAKLYAKYDKKYEDAQSFELGFAQARNYTVIDTTANFPMQSQINSLIKTIIPPKPTVEKIKEDIVGHTWQDNEDGYFGTNPQTIKDGSVKDLIVKSESNQSDTYLLNAIVSLQDRKGSATFMVNSDIKYLLGDADDWTIDYMGTNSVDIEKTGQFDKYITAQITASWAESLLEITNHSDATLIVGGVVLLDHPSEWRKFCIKVEPNSKKTLGGIFFPNILEHEIHFVERK